AFAAADKVPAFAAADKVPAFAAADKVPAFAAADKVPAFAAAETPYKALLVVVQEYPFHPSLPSLILDIQAIQVIDLSILPEEKY
ncbi:hypothetical protein DS031_02385, partial [Bacillus taeanensis]